jgi:hypothetical protein
MRIDPSLHTTKRGRVPWEWVPLDMSAFLEELWHISSHCSDIGHLPIYRGHRERNWLLDSTFVRYVKRHVFGLDLTSKLKRKYRLSIACQRLLGELFLYKFGTQTQPSADLLALAEEKNLDPWFEYMKRMQQYAEEDMGSLKGSFLLDWTQRAEIAVYFANISRQADSDGAVWVADTTAMGAVLHQDLTVGEILDLFQETLRVDKAMGIPLIFCPRNQIACLRARNQDAIYLAQMDLRCDLEEIWRALEEDRGTKENVLLKLVLPKRTNSECAKWLEAHGICEEFISPDKAN